MLKYIQKNCIFHPFKKYFKTTVSRNSVELKSEGKERRERRRDMNVTDGDTQELPVWKCGDSQLSFHVQSKCLGMTTTAELSHRGTLGLSTREGECQMVFLIIVY